MQESALVITQRNLHRNLLISAGGPSLPWRSPWPGLTTWLTSGVSSSNHRSPGICHDSNGMRTQSYRRGPFAPSPADRVVHACG
ncbi:MAG: hypothetical protein JWM42_851 [Burkholderia sp.]|nr:hypothetical protein [Burkholderia sp.]